MCRTRSRTALSHVPNNARGILPDTSNVPLDLSCVTIARRDFIGVNRPAIVRDIPHFGLFPVFLPERPAFLALFLNNQNC